MRILSRIMRVSRLVEMYSMMQFRTARSMMLWPLLMLFIVGSCWGLSDPNITLPGEIAVDTPYDILFIASGFILLSATLGIVLFGFDSISRRRISGVLSLELSQPIPRIDLALSLLLGVWGAVLIPTVIFSVIGMVAIYSQNGNWPSLSESFMFIFATALLLYWYASLQLLASSWAKDMGGAIALGMGTWMLFTMVWVLVTVVVAAILGVDVTDTTNQQYQQLSSTVDLFSPNGVYQMLLESKLNSGLSRVENPMRVSFAALLWTVNPTWLFIKRFEQIN